MQALQHRPRVRLHWFDPFGSVNFQDLCSVPSVQGHANLQLMFWDQEPVYQSTAQDFFTQYRKIYHGPTIIVTSELQSQDLEKICQTYDLRRDYYFFHGWAALDWYRGYNHSYLAKPWRGRSFQYRFMCPNNIIGGGRQHRLRLFAQLVQRDLVNRNLVSFPDVCPYEHESAQSLANKWNIDLPPCQLPRIIDHPGDHSNQSHRIDFWAQGTQAFAHVVTETVFDSTRLHLTEKTFKPIVMQQPFVLVAPRGSLAYLRSYGFRTFGDIWDEGYDDLDDISRIGAIADLLDTISSWSDQEVIEAQQQIADTVEHNYQWFYGGFQDLLWQELTGMINRW